MVIINSCNRLGGTLILLRTNFTFFDVRCAVS
jgi:hypothetical protein